ncbi:MAG: peptide ABC transporter substrate-binding protein [Chitinophagales bacterium]
MLRLRRILVLSLVLVSLLLATQVVAGEQVFRFWHFGPIPTLDPQYHTQGKWLDMIALFEGLTQFDAKFKVVPNIAKSWTVSDDGLVYTFKLRDDVKWSNGDKITAQDFKYSWTRLLDPATNVMSVDPGIWYIKNAKEFSTGKLTDAEKLGIKVVNDYTLEVTLAEPAPDFPATLALPAFFPVPRKVIEKYGASWWRPENFVGNGAFVVQSYSPNTEIVLVRNKNYWGKRPALDRVIVNVGQGLQEVIAYQNDERDMALVGANDLALAESDPILKKELREVPVTTTEWIKWLHSENPALDDVRVRQAISMAIDRDKIAKIAYKGTWKAANSLFTPVIPGYSKNVGLRYDPAKAKKLLAEAGYPNGKGFPTLYILTGPTPTPGALGVADEIQKNLGIKVKLDNKDWGLYNKQAVELQKGDWVGFAYNAMAIPYPDLKAYLGAVNVQEMISYGGLKSADWAEYDRLRRLDIPAAAQRNDDAAVKKMEKRIEEILTKASPASQEFKAAVEAAVKEKDPAKRTALYQKAEDIRMKEAWIIPLFYGVNKWVVKPYVKGLVQNPFRVGFPLYLKTVSVAK